MFNVFIFMGILVFGVSVAAALMVRNSANHSIALGNMVLLYISLIGGFAAGMIADPSKALLFNGFNIYFSCCYCVLVIKLVSHCYFDAKEDWSLRPRWFY